LDLHVELQVVVAKRFVASVWEKTPTLNPLLLSHYVYLQVCKLTGALSSKAAHMKRDLAENYAEEVISGREYQR
jgi:hypothetical protein